ncbi:hypothetical protein [Anianabacter salinae]|uniref:hypothetical protein n=1 Tax=Anianabacter salinae TaxID=2851023 RepID=UPI00225E57E8|nr:hypothetical protein [Anianabacter salinae]MBV0914123.1 hypothetical protein [Anianabacter salinae]
MSLPAWAQTSVDFSENAQATVIVDGAEYSFGGDCMLMGRNGANQLRMSIPGTGPDGAHLFLVLFATSFAPSQFTIYSGADPEAAQEASVNDDRSAWLLRGGGGPAGVEFSAGSITADMAAAVYSNGEKADGDASVQLDVTGC